MRGTDARRAGSRAGNRGQAVLELAVGLFALLIVLVGILSVGLLSRADSDAMVAAQRQALEKSASGTGTGAFDPVSDVLPGPDGRILTPDDEPQRGSLARARRIAAAATPEGGREALAAAALSGGAATALADFAAGGGTPAFGFGRGSAGETVALPPASGPLLGIGPEATVAQEVWMPATGGFE